MIIFFGGPLLDIIANVSINYLEKYNLKPDTTIRVNSDLEQIFTEILQFNPIFRVGGSVTNSVRVFNWISRKSYPVIFTGCLGKDQYGQIIKNKFEDEQIHHHLIEIDNVATGTCAVLLTGEKRTMITHMGASKLYAVEDISEKMWDHLQKAEYLYISAFFLQTSFKVATEVIKYFTKTHKTTIINLAATFLSKQYPKEVLYLFENADIVFGNETEFRAFAKIHNIVAETPQDILTKLKALFNTKRRLLIMTRGHKPLYILHQSEVKEFPTIPISIDKIVDTDGAGDAFVGGFMAQYVHRRSLEECVKCGNWASQEIIQHHGCNFDTNKVYNIYNKY